MGGEALPERAGAAAVDAVEVSLPEGVAADPLLQDMDESDLEGAAAVVPQL
jgi:hypothetical protein